MITNCIKCDISLNRKHIVNGYGNPNADLMIIGECPGYTEDKEGYPFVGKSGAELQLFLDICGFKRKDIFITNIIRCVVYNRPPSKLEISNCLPHMITELKEVNPKIILLLGNTAYHTFYNSDLNISQVIGKWMKLGDIDVICGYHPSYTLRTPSKRKEQFLVFDKVVRKYQEFNVIHIRNY